MDAKKEAKELVYKYQNLVTIWDCRNDEPLDLEFKMDDMKDCALISTKNTIQALKHHTWQNRNIIEHYKEVEQEIIKL